MGIKEFKIKFVETVKTREYQNIRPELEVTVAVGEGDDIDELFDNNEAWAHKKFQLIKESSLRIAGGKKVRKSEKWEFDADDEY